MTTHTVSPESTPSTVRAATPRPPLTRLRTTTSVSGPGRRTTNVAATAKVATLVSMTKSLREVPPRRARLDHSGDGRTPTEEGLMPLAPGLLVIAAGDRRSRPVWHRRCLLVALLALVLLALPLTTVLRAGAVAAGAPGGAAINCTNTDSVLGPLQSSVTLAAGTTGSLQLGSPSAGKGHYVGVCTLTGTVPAGWTVNEGDWVALTATTGSANAGTFVLSTSNSTFVDSGTFTNAGRFEDDSDGLTQTIAVGDFVNTGTVVSEDGGFGTSGTTANPPCPSCTFVDRGTLRVDPKQAFVSGSIFVLAPGGTIDADGNFDIANESTFYVDGGSVTGGVPTTGQYLGQGAATIKFGAQLPASSRGTIDVATDANLQGTIAKHWTVDDTGGSVAATDAGNAGTFAWEGPTTRRSRTPPPSSTPAASPTPPPGGCSTSKCPASSTPAQ